MLPLNFFSHTHFIAQTFVALALSTASSGAADAQIFEGESLKVLNRTGNAGPQSLRPYGEGAWSGNAHLWWTGAMNRGASRKQIPISISPRAN